MIGDNILARMKEYGFTQIEVANSANIAQSTLSAILHGATPKRETLAKIASVLGTSVEALVNVEEPLASECPKCGSRAIVEWNSHVNGHCRIRCAYCELDTGEQNSRGRAISMFNSFKKANVSSADVGNVRVLSLEELLDSSASDAENIRPVWFENRGLFIVPALLQCGVAERELEHVKVEWHDSFGAKSYTLSQYGSWWRCWNNKPTQEMSEETAWKDG